ADPSHCPSTKVRRRPVRASFPRHARPGHGLLCTDHIASMSSTRSEPYRAASEDKGEPLMDPSPSSHVPQVSALQLYVAVLDDIRANALLIVEWSEGSLQECEAITMWGQGGTNENDRSQGEPSTTSDTSP